MVSSEQIRRASSHDLNQIVELEKKCFHIDFVYSRRQLRYLLTKAHSTVLVVTSNKIIRGFIIILYRKGTRVAGIETIDVDPAYQKQGIGLRLLTEAEEEIRKKDMKKIRLEVSIENLAAINLYKKAGYRILVLLHNYYRFDKEGTRDALRMTKEFN
jgi:ribosomal protein S18 acetylase RimI-like enzyme